METLEKDSHLSKQKHLLNFWQWLRVFKVLNKREKIFFFVCLFACLGSLFFLASKALLNKGSVLPSFGGEYIEGIVGQPSFINPFLATSDADKDLIELLFSGLMRYDLQGGIILDLAEKYEIKEDGRVYDFFLKKDAKWHDGTPLLADDVVFTIEAVQNPDFKNMERANWLGVETEKISDNIVRFKLEEPYSPFLERATIKIMPKHIWQEVSPQNLALAFQYNLKPIGSGPYKFGELKQSGIGNIEALTLVANNSFYRKTPHISKITFLFFKNEEDLFAAARKGGIDGFSPLNPGDKNLFEKSKFTSYNLSLPRYFAVFLKDETPDNKTSILAKKEVRQALNFAVDRQEIIEKALKGEGKEATSPILPEIYGFAKSTVVYEFSLEKAEALLKKAGYEKQNNVFVEPAKKTIVFKTDLKQGDENSEVRALQECLSKFPDIYPEGKITGYFGPSTKEAVIAFQEKYKSEILTPGGFTKGTGMVAEGTRKKLNELCAPPQPEAKALKISLAAPNQPFLIETANLLKEQWEKLGIQVEITVMEASEMAKNYIKPRNYESLLFGQVLGGIPDLFPFWHSTWRKDPGLNLTFFEDKKADKMLEGARKTSDPQIRKENYEGFQDIILEEAPAVFLYNPNYVYLLSNKIKGADFQTIISPSKRFCEIEQWYIETKGVF